MNTIDRGLYKMTIIKKTDGTLEKSFQLPFTDRKSYISWRDEYRKWINDMAREQRNHRKNQREATDDYGRSKAQSERFGNREYITDMLGARRASKILASKQHDEVKKTAVPA